MSPRADEERQVEVVPIHNVDDLNASSLPSNIPEDIADDIITNAKRLLEGKLIRKAFNSDDYEVARDHTSRSLVVTVTKQGLAACKRNECLHFTMFHICEHSLSVALFNGNVDVLLNYAHKKSNHPNLLNTTRFGNPSGSGTKKGFKRQRRSGKVDF